MADQGPAPPLNPVSVVAVLMLLGGIAIALCERGSRALLAQQEASGSLPDGYQGLAGLMNGYLRARQHVIDHWLLYATLAIFGPAVLLLILKKAAGALNRAREQMAGMAFHKESYDLPRVSFPLRDLIMANPAPDRQVVLGVDQDRRPVYLTDQARSMHVHCLGQTGSGKTKSVIEPLLFQDLWRGRGVLVVDGKGSQENEERLAAMAGAAGRSAEVKSFTLSPFRPSHTYNPLHLVAGAEPKAVAERVFSSFADDMDNPYYRDQSRMFFTTLVETLAGTGRRFSMQDVAAAIASPDVLDHVLSLSSDARARRGIETQCERLGRKVGETLTGLLAAVQRYDLPIVNAYDPDIVLEEEIDRGGIVGFFLPANYAKYLARYMGLIVFQHLQQVGALRQLDRSRSQRPVYVFADEFYSFAYEGFTDAVNKLRDANVAILLAHQTFSDLEKVSPEFANGIWDNTRNKVILYQNQFEICDRISKALGTEKQVELTLRRSVDGFLNSTNMLEASSKEVDAYRLHPNRIKSLQCGQGYLAQDADFVGLCFEQIPFLADGRAEGLPPASIPAPKPRSRDGLNLTDFLVTGRPAASAGPGTGAR